MSSNEQDIHIVSANSWVVRMLKVVAKAVLFHLTYHGPTTASSFYVDFLSKRGDLMSLPNRVIIMCQTPQANKGEIMIQRNCILLYSKVKNSA